MPVEPFQNQGASKKGQRGRTPCFWSGSVGLPFKRQSLPSSGTDVKLTLWISDERFTELSADYEAEQRELKERAAAIQAELSKAQEATVNAEKFMNVVRRHTSFEELTPTLLREFVEKIVVHECSYDENKTRRQDIEIYYSFVGKVDLPE